jgi:hypothetical protein
MALAKDGDNNVEYAEPSAFVVCSTVIWDQWLQYGWNKLTIPFGMCDAAMGVDRILDCLNNSGVYSYDGIFHYDPDLYPYDWGIYSPYVPAHVNDFDEIQDGEDYWIHCTELDGTRYYIGLPEIEIANPENGETYDGLDEINGTAWSSDADIEKVEIRIYYYNETSVKHYWNGTDWVLDVEKLLCDLEPGYQQHWSYDSSNVRWIPGATHYVKATTNDEWGCIAGDTNTFDMVSYTLNGTIYLNETVTMEPGDALAIALTDHWPPPPGPGLEGMLGWITIFDPEFPELYSFEVISGTYYVLGLLFNDTGSGPYAAGAVLNMEIQDLIDNGPDEIIVNGANKPEQDLIIHPLPMP